MEVLYDFMHYPWAQRALFASVMVAVSCGILGTFITLRNMSLLGDALSHAVLPGIVLSYILFGYNVLGFYFGAVIAGMICAVAITWLQKRAGARNDAAIGIVFSAMFALGIIGISYLSRTQGVHLDLKDFLFGNVLGVSDFDLQISAMVLLFVCISIVLFYRYFFISSFQPGVALTLGIPVNFMHYFLMLLLSFVIVSALQTVGVIMVVSMLVGPSSTALLLHKRLKIVLILSGIIGALSAIGGIIVSIIWETAPGPAIAVVSTILYLLAVAFSPEKGVITKIIESQQFNTKILAEDLLKYLYKNNGVKVNDYLHFFNIRKTNPFQKWYTINKMTRFNLVRKTADTLILTQLGIATAEKIIRAHRLWETYLVNSIGLNVNQIHHSAETIEHHLTEEQLKELGEFLDFPETDPHGSPIPK